MPPKITRNDNGDILTDEPKIKIAEPNLMDLYEAYLLKAIERNRLNDELDELTKQIYNLKKG